MRAGGTDPEIRVTPGDQRVRADRADLAHVLRGLVGARQPFVLGWPGQHLTFLDRKMAQRSTGIAQRLPNVEDALPA